MKKKLLLVLPLLLMSIGNASCGSKKTLTIWVGAESVDFYTAKMDEYAANYKTETGKELPAYVVKGVDSGSAAAVYLQDTEAGPDIFTIPHDNLGKLTEGSSTIAPITDQALLDQIENDNPESFKVAAKSNVQGTEYVFGIPFSISLHTLAGITIV